ncbi:hypothetical protein CPAV1605_90 [seawater metagenome]|uniref:Uncharacterized protein n=1 Tax=seawater metagenome TaxID=1561972 RepID=A0A5E8CFW5_9ZZZZ
MGNKKQSLFKNIYLYKLMISSYKYFPARVFLSLIASVFLIILIRTLIQYPILKAFNSYSSSLAWLKTTIFDFYVQTFAFSAIVLATEGFKKGIIWVLLNFCLGSPFAVIYLLTKKLWKLG